MIYFGPNPCRLWLNRGGQRRSVTAVDGVDALAKIAQPPSDVLILDVMMPNLDGLTLFTKSSANASTSDGLKRKITGAPAPGEQWLPGVFAAFQSRPPWY